MTKVRIPSGIELEYEAIGSLRDPAIVLINGFGAQLLSWPEGLCRQLANRGRLVIRFDGRDSGLSSKLDDHPVDLGAIVASASTGDAAAVRPLVPYTLHDMADDVVGLLDELSVRSAHVVGASMGGMIAQLVAIRYAERTPSLTSMMSSTGEPEYGKSTPEAAAALVGSPAADRSTYICAAVAAARVWASNLYFDADAAAGLAAASYDRGHSPAGAARQLGALLATGSLANEIRRVPTLVIHGLDDTLVTPSGGQRTANLISDFELLLVPDMGHDRPEPPSAAPLRSHHRTYHPPSLTTQPRADAIEELGNRWVVMADPEGNEFCVCDAGQHE
jgi:pimeloyl-ACP methyl ester carboxylesterase